MPVSKLILIVALLALVSPRRGDNPHHLISPSHLSRLSDKQDMCRLQCAFLHRDNAALLTACCSQCQRITKSSYLLLFSILLLAFLFFIISIAIEKKCFSSNFLNTDSFPVGPSPSNAREKLIDFCKAQQELPCLTKMSREEFRLQKLKFQNKIWKIQGILSNGAMVNSEVDFKLEWDDKFVCKLEGRGRDKEGNWNSEGTWFCGEVGLKLWMVKRCNEKKGKNSLHMIVYNGQQKTEGLWEGDWYEVDDEGNRGKSGVWKMREELFGKMNLQKRESIQSDNFK